MSLHPRPAGSIPEETQRVAHAAFPKDTLYLRIAGERGPLDRDAQLAELFPTRGQPAASPAQLALVSGLQDVEGLSDRQAADRPSSRRDPSAIPGGCGGLSFGTVRVPPRLLRFYALSSTLAHFSAPISPAQVDREVALR